MRSKKGVSDILLVIMFILLALIAITILILSLRPLLTNAGEDAQSAASCLTLDLSVVSCTYTNETVEFDGRLAGIKVKKGSGGGEVDELRFIFEDKDGNRVIRNSSSTIYSFNPPGELETSFTALKIGYFEPKLAGVAAVINDGKKVCEFYNAPKSCEFNFFEGCMDDYNNDNILDTRDILVLIGLLGQAINSGTYDESVDVNGDLVNNAQDLLDAITAFRAGILCP